MVVNSISPDAGGYMRKLTDYAVVAATEYLQESGNDTLDSLWLAEFFQDCGVQDDYPAQDLIGFYKLVQKALTLEIVRVEKLARLQQDKSSHSANHPRKPSGG
jgi:hypothetical protein